MGRSSPAPTVCVFSIGRKLPSEQSPPQIRREMQMEIPLNDEVVQTEARKGARRAPSASNSITMRVRIENKVGMIGEVVSAIGRAGSDVGAIDIVQVTGEHVIRDITVDGRKVAEAVT